MATTTKERCGFKLGNDYDEDQEDRECQRIAVQIVRTTGSRPLTRRLCARCADVLARRYTLNDIEYDIEAL